MAKAAAQGEGIAQIRRALNTVGLKHKDDESETEYAARAADHMARLVMRHAGVAGAGHDELYVGGLFVFIVANHLTYMLEAEFEHAASLGLLMFLTASGMSLDDAATSNEAIANTYNDMSVRNDKYLQAVGQQFVKWTQMPSEEGMQKLAELFSIGRRGIDLA
jgi:hypothetical protein